MRRCQPPPVSRSPLGATVSDAVALPASARDARGLQQSCLYYALWAGYAGHMAAGLVLVGLGHRALAGAFLGLCAITQPGRRLDPLQTLDDSRRQTRTIARAQCPALAASGTALNRAHSSPDAVAQSAVDKACCCYSAWIIRNARRITGPRGLYRSLWKPRRVSWICGEWPRIGNSISVACGIASALLAQHVVTPQGFLDSLGGPVLAIAVLSFSPIEHQRWASASCRTRRWFMWRGAPPAG